MFVDIRGFTRVAADLSPRAALNYVNAFLEDVLPIITASGGHVDKYTGDGFLAVFGAFESTPSHATSAVRAACEIVAMAAERASWRVGIGISTGTVLAGTIGAHGRHEFTIIGDAVNVASRVETLAKRMEEPVLLTESTRRRLATGSLQLRPCGIEVIRGTGEAIALFAPVVP
jgi:class 3 adenylate cyclase